MGGVAPKEGLLVTQNQNGADASRQNGSGGQSTQSTVEGQTQADADEEAAEAAMDEERRFLVNALRQIGAGAALESRRDCPICHLKISPNKS